MDTDKGVYNENRRKLKEFCSLKFDFPKFKLVEPNESNKILSSFKDSTYKDFKLSCSNTNFVMMAKNIIERSKRFENLISHAEKFPNMRLWFDLEEPSLKAIENYIYKCDVDSDVDFIHTFELLKVAIFLADKPLKDNLVKYLSLSIESIEKLSSNEEVLKLLIFLSLDLTAFLDELQQNLKVVEVSKEELNLPSTILSTIVNQILKKDNLLAFMRWWMNV